jgi:hypothetical protein
MITERELLQAIRECEAEPITASKVSKLADFYIVYDHLFCEPVDNGYSYKNETVETIKISGGTDFLQAVNNKDCEKVMNVIDELMDTIEVLHPRIYDSVIQKIQDL